MNREGRTAEGHAGRSGPASDASPVVDHGFGSSEYNVRTGVDVTAEDPAAAMIAAVQQMGIRDPETFCFHVEQLRTGRKWYVDLSPGGEVEVQDWDERTESPSARAS
jgi:hypothetical protein